MGEAQDTLFEPEFNRAVKVQTSEQRITSRAGDLPPFSIPGVMRVRVG